ncbi:hypothetical protein EW146_g7473, partial [Bondarzewia mesenterica]
MYRPSSEELPHELIISIQRVLDLHPGPDTDPLDNLSDEFDSVNVLNGYFPDEASLGQLDAVQARLAQDEQDLQHEITALQEELRLQQDPNKMQIIQEMISDLLGQMSLIREKATESEAIVRNITKDIQVLDLAKKNLILSMTTLKRLQMLVNALSQLEDYVKNKKYAEITQSLAAVKQISASFKPYTSVPRIAQLWKHIQEIQGEIRSLIEADFDAYYLQSANAPKPHTIANASAAADILGADVRIALTARYTAQLLAEYRRVFRLTDEAGQLDNISRRFAWFRRLLSTHEGGLGRAFLEEWKVGWWLRVWIEGSSARDDMAALLSRAGKDLTVAMLLDALQQTKDFELSMARKFATPFQDILQATSSTPTRPLQPISSAFEPYMGVYVDAQDKTIADMLAPHRGPRARTSLDTAQSATESEDGDAPAAAVLPSSTELFYIYGQTLEGCAKLSTGKPLFELCSVFRKWLRIYAEEVLATNRKKSAVQSRRSMDSRWDISEVKNACLLINTADYCQTTAQELEEKLREKISAEYKTKISFQAECDLFISVASGAIFILLRELEVACEPPLQTLTRTAWATQNEQVSGQSSFVDDLVRTLETVAETVKPLIEGKKYLRNFFRQGRQVRLYLSRGWNVGPGADGAAGMGSLIITRFTNALVKSRPLRENGAEQLLIDLSVLKACLLKLPGEALTTSGYTRSITKGTQRLEALLKVIVTPQVRFFSLFLPTRACSFLRYVCCLWVLVLALSAPDLSVAKTRLKASYSTIPSLSAMRPSPIFKRYSPCSTSIFIVYSVILLLPINAHPAISQNLPFIFPAHACMNTFVLDLQTHTRSAPSRKLPNHAQRPQILDLKGTPRSEENDLLDAFVTTTSTKPELEQTSFLTALDMDPPANGTMLQTGALTSPSGSRVSLPSLLASPGAGEGILAALG